MYARHTLSGLRFPRLVIIFLVTQHIKCQISAGDITQNRCQPTPTNGAKPEGEFSAYDGFYDVVHIGANDALCLFSSGCVFKCPI